jgi:dTDP-4-dehydrorhamnose reductase
MVVTGREGQVVRSLLEKASAAGVQIARLGRPDFELTSPEDAIFRMIVAAVPDVIVSAAAYTQVDKAEGEPELAFAINEGGARAVARAARRLHVPLVHLSTDYVFDGTKPDPYVEGDPPNPASVYGASKLAGEEAVQAEQPNSAVLRTAWVYSPFGANFVRTMFRLAKLHDEIRVVSDQYGNPTSADEIAGGVIAVARNLVSSDDPNQRGIFHMTAAGDASWAELAEEIFAISAEKGGPTASVTHIGTADYPTAARRPANSRLNCNRLAHAHDVRLPEWRLSLRSVVHRLLEQEL